MKTIYNFFLLFLSALFVLLISERVSAQIIPEYTLTAKNITLAGNSLEFDIYLLHTNPGISDPFQYGSCQYCLTFDTAISNGGVLTLTRISSDLPVNMQPVTIEANKPLAQLRFSGNLPSPGFFVSFSYPGTKIIRVRLATTALVFSSTPFNLQWRNTGSGLITKLSYFRPNNLTVFITNPSGHIVDTSQTKSQLINPTYNLTIFPGPVPFVWHNTNAANYTLQVARDSLMNDLVVNDSLITDTVRTITMNEIDKKYFWRILSRDSSNQFTASSTSMFRTGIQINPPQNSVNLTTAINFVWYKAVNAQYYALRISTDSLQNNIVLHDSTLTDTFKVVDNLLNGKKYYWTIRETDNANNTVQSAVWNFKTVALTLALVSPLNNAVNIPATMDFSWQKVFQNPLYELKISTDSNQNNIVFLDSGITDTIKTVTGLVYDKKYYWSVKQTDTNGNTAESVTRTFRTIPLKITLVSPADNSTDLLSPVVFKWMKNANSIKYILKISFDSAQTSVVHIDSTITDTMKLVGGFLGSKKYFWSVTGVDSTNYRNFSDVRNFKIAPVDLISPLNNLTNQPSSVNFVWKKYPGATRYILRIAREETQTYTVFIDSTITDTFKTVSGFITDYTYYWTVTAVNAQNIIAVSEMRSFSTVQILASPYDGERITLNHPIAFKWHRITGASSYKLVISNDTALTNIVYSDSTLTDTVKILNNYPVGNYYWKIFAKNTSGYFLSSSRWSFDIYFDWPSPVELSAFTYAVNRNIVKLDWTTAAEVNNSGFDIERNSVSGGDDDWLKTGSVTGNGTSTVMNNYSFEDRNLTTGKYKYRLKQIDFNGHYEYFNLNGEVSIGVPAKFTLSQNYPNPFNPSTKIDFELPSDGNVNLILYDLLGKEVAILLSETKTAGYYTLNFTGNNLASGIYFYRITSDEFSDVKRMVLVK